MEGGKVALAKKEEEMWDFQNNFTSSKDHVQPVLWKTQSSREK